MTPKERAKSVPLFACWASDPKDTRTWDDVRAEIEEQIRAAVAEEREACVVVARDERDMRMSQATASAESGDPEWALILRLRAATAEEIATAIRARA